MYILIVRFKKDDGEISEHSKVILKLRVTCSNVLVIYTNSVPCISPPPPPPPFILAPKKSLTN